MKTIKDVIARLDELEETNKAEIKECNVELRTTREALEALREERENVTTPEEYKRITADIREKEDYINFLENKKKAVQTPPLSKEEYKEAKAIIDATLAKKAKETAPEILGQLPALIKLMEDYLDSFDELNTTYKKALKLNGSNAYAGANLDRVIIAGDNDGAFKAFVLMCFKMHDDEVRRKLEAMQAEKLRSEKPPASTPAPEKTARVFPDIIRFF